MNKGTYTNARNVRVGLQRGTSFASSTVIKAPIARRNIEVGEGDIAVACAGGIPTKKKIGTHIEVNQVEHARAEDRTEKDQTAKVIYWPRMTTKCGKV